MQEGRAEQVEHLGRQSSDALDLPQAIPFEGTDGGSFVVTLSCGEFTSRCPVTSQPDYASLVVEFEPDAQIVETKSLKLYLQKFREVAAFNEDLVALICRELFDVLEPKHLRVSMAFGARGGISVQPSAQLWATPGPEEVA